MLYRPIRKYAELPQDGALDAETRERHDRDFKQFVDPRDPTEHAKDMAAFANVLGGVIIVGGEVENGDRVKYNGVRGQTPDDVKEIYEKQAMKLCAPAPSIDVIPIRLPDGRYVVAVNVDPYLDQPIASRARTRDQNGGMQTHSDAWVFPYRVASQTRFLDPRELPMYMDPRTRRALILLHRIPAKATLCVFVSSVWVPEGRGTGAHETTRSIGRLGTISPSENAVEFQLSQGKQKVWVPLRSIIDVWRHVSEAIWNVSVDGYFVSAQAPELPKGNEYLEFQPALR